MSNKIFSPNHNNLCAMTQHNMESRMERVNMSILNRC